MTEIQTKSFSLPRTLATGLVAIALVAGLPMGGAQAMSLNEIDKILVKTSPAVFGFLKAEFRTDYDNLVVALEQAEAEGGDIRGTTAGQVAAWRTSQADTIVHADDAAHMDMLGHYVDTLAQIRDVGGAEACGNFILYGSANLTTEEVNGAYQEPLDGYLVAMLHAAASAKDEPMRRKAASDADWDHVFDIMEERGGTDADLDALIAMDALDPTYCEATIRFLDAMLVDGDKAVSRVRAEYIGDLVRAV